MTQDNLESLRMIDDLTHHNIPQYAYGDNEAACELAQRLEKIEHLLFPIIQEAEEEDENFNDEDDWVDPAGGHHHGNEDDPAKSYE